MPGLSDDDIGLVQQAQYTQPTLPQQAQSKGLSDADIGLSDQDIGLDQGKPEKQPWSVSDVVKSVGSGLVRGAEATPEALAAAQRLYGRGAGWLADKAGMDPASSSFLGSAAEHLIRPALGGIAPSQVSDLYHRYLEPHLHTPESTAGEYAQTTGEFLGNPLTYTGAGSVAGKVATGITSALGSEALGQAAEGTSAELPARIAGAVLGAKAPRMAARAITPLPISPERQATVDILRQGGLEPTAGDVSGSRLVRMAESTMGTAPGSFGAFLKNKSAVDRSFSRYAVNSMGENAPTATPEVLQSARDRLGDQFEKSAMRMKIIHDQPLGDELTNISSDLMKEGLPETTIGRIQQQMENIQNGFVTAAKGKPRGVMDGKTYQSLTRKDTPLDRAMSDQDPNVAYYATRIRSALDDAMERSAFRQGTRPGKGNREAYEDLKAARRQWFNMMAIQSAVTGAGENAAEGVVSPQKLRQALTNTQDRKTAYALGRSDLSNFARAGNQILTPVPSSMTTERTLVANVPRMLAGAGLGYEADREHPARGALAGAFATGLAGRALMSRPMQSYLKNQQFTPYLGTPQPRLNAYGRPIAGVGPHAGEEQERASGGRVVAANIDHNPTEAQKEAGNYAKDHVNVHGLDIAIENAKGKFRRGVDKGGKPWAVKMPAHYGYIKGTVGKDKDHVDVYLGPHIKAPTVYVVDQLNADTKQFDEHKAFIGFTSETQVKNVYKAAFSDGRAHERLGHLAAIPIDEFKHWLENGDTTKRIEVTQAKVAHAQVDYVSKSPHKDQRCNLCTHFIPATKDKWAACTGVRSPIAPGGWCQRFEKRRQG